MDCDYAVVAVILLLTQQYILFSDSPWFRVWGLEHFSAAWSIANVTNSVTF